VLRVILIRTLHRRNQIKWVSLDKHEKQAKHTITIAIPNAVNVSPHFPVLNAHPLLLAITHALSSPPRRRNALVLSPEMAGLTAACSSRSVIVVVKAGQGDNM
jgi:hypothetical protein